MKIIRIRPDALSGLDFIIKRAGEKRRLGTCTVTHRFADHGDLDRGSNCPCGVSASPIRRDATLSRIGVMDDSTRRKFILKFPWSELSAEDRKSVRMLGREILFVDESRVRFDGAAWAREGASYSETQEATEADGFLAEMAEGG